MNIILIITDKDINIDSFASFKTENINIASIKNSKYLKHYLEEYIPSYLIIDSSEIDIKTLKDYSEKNISIRIFIFSEKIENKNLPDNFFILRRNEDYISSTIKIISDFEKEKKEGLFFDKFKFLKFHIIPVTSFKGGSGKTTFAFNTSFFLNKILNKKVLLADFNFCNGPSDIACYLNLNHLPNLGNYIDDFGESENALSRSLAETHDNEISILLPPLSTEKAGIFNKKILTSLIEEIRKTYDFMVIDIPAKFDDVFFEIADYANYFINIISPEGGCMQRTDEFIKNMPSHKNIINILNRQNDGCEPSSKNCARFDVFDEISFKDKHDKKFISFSGKETKILKFEEETKRIINRLWKNE